MSSLSAWISENPQDGSAFSHTLRVFQRYPKNPRLVFHSLRTLLAAAPDLLRRLDELSAEFPHPHNLESDFADFMATIGEIAGNPRLGLTVGESLSYHTEGFIPLDILHHSLGGLLCELDPDLQNVIHWAADEIAFRVRLSRTAPLEREDRPRIATLPVSVDLRPLFEVPAQLQFLSAVHLLVAGPRNVASVMKCLRLFSANMIAIEDAGDWIGRFDAKLQGLFERVVLQCEPASFFPQRLRALIDKLFRAKQQQQWAFGAIVTDALASQAPLQREASGDGKTVTIEVHEGKVDLVPESVFAIQAGILLGAMKSAAVALQKRAPVEFSGDVQQALYGTANLAHLGRGGKAVIFKRAAKLGQIGLDLHHSYVVAAMAQMPLRSAAWRAEYFRLLEPSSVSQILNLSGFSASFPSHFTLLFDVLEKFLAKFPSIDPRRIVELRESLASGVRFLTQHAALAVYYAFAVAHLIEGAILEFGSEPLLAIADLVFEVPPPLDAFGENPIAHVDVPLLRLAKMIKRMKSAFFSTPDIAVVLSEPSEPFFYELSVEGSAFSLKGAVNPQIRRTPRPPSSCSDTPEHASGEPPPAANPPP